MNIQGELFLNDWIFRNIQCNICLEKVRTFASESDKCVMMGNIRAHIYSHVRNVPSSEYDDYFMWTNQFLAIMTIKNKSYDVRAIVSDMIPQLLLICPVDEFQCEKLHKLITDNDYGLDFHNSYIDRSIFNLFMNADYKCSLCGDRYESGLPSYILVSRHFLKCAQIKRKLN